MTGTSIPITSLINSCIPRFFAFGVIYGQLVFVYFSLSLYLFSSSFLIKWEGGWCWDGGLCVIKKVNKLVSQVI